MATENLLSIEIPAEQLTLVHQKISEISSILNPFLKALSPNEIRSLYKMNDKSVPFVEKCVDYAKLNPEFLPPFVKIEELEKDLIAVKQLMEIYRPILQLADNIQDTTILAGSEALSASLAFYNSIKQASKLNVTNAKTIYEDLKKRFEQSPKQTEPSSN